MKNVYTSTLITSILSKIRVQRTDLLSTFIAPTLSIMLFALLLLPIEASAAIFEPPHTDKSLEYLGVVFGGRLGGINLGLTSSDTSHVFGHLFQVFNGIVLAVAIFILSYVGIVSTVNTAQEGQVMGKKWSSVWIPLRSALGLLLLAPIPNSGYSILQVSLMWVILNGVGAADKLWNLVLTNLAHGISVTQSTNLTHNPAYGYLPFAISEPAILLEDGSLIGINLLNNLTCLEILKDKTNNNTLKPRFVNENFRPGIGTPVGTTTMTGTLQFGTNYNPNTPESQHICGKIQIDAHLSPDDITSNTGANQVPDYINTTQEDQIVKTIYNTKKHALSLMIDYIRPIAKEIASTRNKTTNEVDLQSIQNILNKPGLLYNATIIYQKAMSSLTKEAMIANVEGPILASHDHPDLLSTTDFIEQGKHFGWITAGSFYYLFNQKTTLALLDSAKTIPNLTDDDNNKVNPFATLTERNIGGNGWFKRALENASLGTPYTLFEPVAHYINKNLNLVYKLFSEPPKHAIRRGQVNKLFTPAYINDLVAQHGDHHFLQVFTQNAKIMQIVKKLNENIQTLFVGHQEEPLLSQAKFGMQLMETAEGLWVEVITSIFNGNSINKIIGDIGGNAATASILIGVLPALVTFVGIMWTLGAGLAIYTPMIPYMMFTVTALSWIILVVEAIVAAPIIALGLITPAQDELGKIIPALGIIANIFLKPMLMIIGLITGAKIYKAAIIMVNLGFEFSFETMKAQIGTSSFSWLAMLILYVGFIMTLVNKCYALIYHLPDKVLRWIGVTGEPTDVANVKEVQQSFDQQTKQGASIIETPAAVASYHLVNKASKKQHDHFPPHGPRGRGEGEPPPQDDA